VTAIDTRERLLNAAEHLFAEQGVGNTSLRAVTAEAGANLASVHYHFGSKEALIRAVIARRLEPVNAERLQLLSQVEGDGTPELDRILEAFVAPALKLIHDPAHGGRCFMCLMAQLHAETGDLKAIAMAQLDTVITRFSAALQRALPGVPTATVLWRFAFTIGSMVFIMGHADTLKDKSRGLCDPSDVDTTLRQIVAYASAGLRAHVAGDSGDSE